MNSFVKTFLKFALAAALIGKLLSQNKLDFGPVIHSLDNPSFVLAGISLIIAINFLAAWRWKKLLEIGIDLKQQKNISYLTIARLTWIGLFFNVLLPGAVSGDLIKYGYARNLGVKSSKKTIMASILIDRVIGLIALLILLGAFSIANYQGVVVKSLALSKLVHFNFFLLAAALFFLLGLLHPGPWKEIAKKTAKLPLGLPRIFAIPLIFAPFGEKKNSLYLALTVSLACQFLNILAFYVVIFPFVERDLSFTEAFTFIPIGLIAVAIPISPAGLGVGHAAFDQLFSFAKISGGASLFNIYFLSLISVNILGGAIPFLWKKEKARL